MTTARSESEWQVLVQDLDGSGLSARSFAEQRGLNVRTVVWWRSYFRRRGREVETRSPPAVQLAAVRRVSHPKEGRSKTSGTPLALFACGVRIGVSPGFDRATLSSLLDVLDARREGRS